MSYYQSSPNYYRNPVPYLSSDIGEPVPGWGVHVPVAGPARLGVGAVTGPAMMISPAVMAKVTALKPMALPKVAVEAGPGAPAPTPEKMTPWWIWPVAAAVVVGGVGYYGTKKGWF